MTKRRLSGVVALGIALLVISVRYAFHQPHIPGAVRCAIPAQATFVHEADSLEALLQSPVCGQLDKALGAGNTLKQLDSSSDWFRRFVPAEVVVMGLPVRYGGQTESWAAVSWVGWRSPWLRWQLEHTRAEGFSRIGKHNVWPVWRYESLEIARGSSLTFALTDNLFIACLSSNPTDIRALLDAYDHKTPSTGFPNTRK